MSKKEPTREHVGRDDATVAPQVRPARTKKPLKGKPDESEAARERARQRSGQDD